MDTIPNHGVLEIENGDAATSPQNEIPETLDPKAPMAWRDGNEIVFSRLGDDHVFRISEHELRCLIAGLDQTESPSEQNLTLGNVYDVSDEAILLPQREAPDRSDDDMQSHEE